MAALGNPQKKLPPVIHVAGTNGKGSTIAFLRAFLEAADLRVHAYTSPHLVRFAERIRIAGKLIEEDTLAAVLEECERANGAEPITYFEITTAAAFLAFARVPADYVLVEVGLGGRFDATNVIAHPAVAAITPISLDHQHFLGDTIGKIAFEKSGIIKTDTPAVIARQSAEAAAVLEARAGELSAPLYRQGIEWEVSARANGELAYRGRSSFDLPPPGLLGPHQYDNAGTALACIDSLPDLALRAAALEHGMRRVEWPARLQRIATGTLAALVPESTELWLDGGHNEAGGAALGEVARAWHDRPLHIVFGMLRTHDATAFLRLLAPHTAHLAAIAIPGEANTLSADEAANAARAAGIVATPYDSIAAAVRAMAPPHTRILICGSLYLAGRVLAENDAPD